MIYISFFNKPCFISIFDNRMLRSISSETFNPLNPPTDHEHILANSHIKASGLILPNMLFFPPDSACGKKRSHGITDGLLPVVEMFHLPCQVRRKHPVDLNVRYGFNLGKILRRYYTI